MFRGRLGAFSSAVAFALGGTLAFAGGPNFTSTPSVMPSVEIGTRLDFDLASLLADKGPSALTWGIGSVKPPLWLELDAARGHLVGIPRYADAGPWSFKITLQTPGAAAVEQPVTLFVLAPPIWNSDALDLGIQNEGKAWSFALGTSVQNPAGGPVTFEASGLPAWLTLDPKNGVLTGTPPRSAAGPYVGIQITARGKGGGANVPAHGLVVKTAKSPAWSKPEIELPEALERVPFSRSVLPFVANADGAEITYDLVSAPEPAWLRIGRTSGTLFGTPAKGNLGKQSARVLIRGRAGGQSFEDTATFTFTVNHVNQAPTWKSKLTHLPDAQTGVPFTQNLDRSVEDSDDDDKLTFEVLAGPKWAALDPQSGVLTGTPPKEAAGLNTWLFSVADNAGLTDTATFEVEVHRSNEPPRWNAKTISLPNVRQGTPFELDLTPYVKDPDGDTLAFTQIDGPTWAQVTSLGALSLRPRNGDVGPVKFRVKVADATAGSDVTEISLFVDKTNHPPTWLLDPIRLNLKEDEAAHLDISAYARDYDPQDSLVFGILEGPGWAQISKEGLITGVAQRSANGTTPTSFRVRAMDLEAAHADVKILLTVRPVNHPPQFTSELVTLNSAKVGFDYRGSLAPFAKDSDGSDKLSFEKAASTPAWVNVAADGTVSGNPPAASLGRNAFPVRVMDQDNEFALTQVQISVEKDNRPPRWRQSPLALDDAGEGATYQFDLTPYGVDPDADRLLYAKVSGPDWLAVSPEGLLTGIPRAGDLGPLRATLRVSDGTLSADVPVTGQVVARNQAPMLADIPAFSVKERQALKLSLDQPTYVRDQEKDLLHFKLTTPSDWVTLSDAGELSAQPKFKNIGENTIGFSVDDGKIPVRGQVRINVQRDPRAPVWIEDPLFFNATANAKWTASLAGRARDLDRQTVTYAKKSGKAWLQLDGAGNLQGTPTSADLGANAFVVTACNQEGICSPAQVIVNVDTGAAHDSISLDDIVPGARADSLWVLDHSGPSEPLVRELKGAISLFYDGLRANQVTGAALLLSGEAKKWDGAPVRADGQPAVILSGDVKPAAEFNRRTDLAYGAGACSNCENSPVWSLYRFFERLPSLTDVYQKVFAVPATPLDVFIVTTQRDHYPAFAGAQPALRDFTAVDFARDFADRARAASVPLRIHALAPACPQLVEASPDAASAAPENTYRLLVEKTQGRYYAEGCDYNINSVLSDFADRASRRAKAHARPHVPLSKVPTDAQKIRVTLAGVPLPGNTGTPTDRWTFDPKTNEIRLLWALIDEGQLKKGDTLELSYPIP